MYGGEADEVVGRRITKMGELEGGRRASDRRVEEDAMQ